MRILCFALFIGLLHGQMLQTIVNAGSAGGAAIAVTGKHCEHENGGSATTAVCTWSANPSVGENIHCFAFDFGATTNAFSVTDNAGTPNTYTANGARYRGTGLTGDYLFFDAVAIANSPSTTTVTRTGGSFMGLGCYSTTGENASSPVDGDVGTYSQASGAGPLTTNVVPTQTTDIAQCGGAIPGGTNLLSGTGFTLISTVASNIKVEYKLLNSSGSQAATMNLEASLAGDMICATYKK